MPEPITLVAVGGGMIGLATHLARRYFEMAKEVVDVILGTVVLILSLPILGVCAIIIKLSSKGSVFYSQVRAGKNGKPFRMYKLRTMRADAESDTGAVWAQDNDPRVIRWCRWMRHSHVDELPQLVNVIKGDMSLVGPRPERLEIMAELEKRYPEVRKRLSVRPGITGLAQVRNGYDTSVQAFKDKLEADLRYIERRKWGMELRILAATMTKFNDKESR
ncbi:MAG: sugar transferase [Planctomycetota bacterium]|nr:sugar transferase [Planctomycetota bacterium]